jgi:N-acetylmuramic acid 6-phosphate etherase
MPRETVVVPVKNKGRPFSALAVHHNGLLRNFTPQPTPMERITESPSHYDHLERLSTAELLEGINHEDRGVPLAIGRVLPAIGALIDAIVPRMRRGGRLFYLGAGTSGRLGIVDASECPPTFGVPHGLVVGLIAGGDQAIRKAVEFAEDDREQGWKDLEEHAVGADDTVIGIAASGGTPYVIGALERCRAQGILTGCITCNPGSPVTTVADHPIVVVVGPEFVTGSTRMKSGTAQKLVLNMLSTAVMIHLGRVKGNRMVDMQLSNNKLIDRGTRMVMEGLGVDYDRANALLKQHGSVRKAVEAGKV